MKRAFRSLVLVPLVLAAVSCQATPAGLSQAQKDAAAAEAKRVVDVIFQKSDQLDFAGALALYSPDPDGRYVENGVIAASLDALKQQYAELGSILELLENKRDPETVVVLSEDAVTMTVPVHVRIKAKGRPEYSGQYVWSGTIQRRGGTWLVVHSHESWVDAEQMMAAIMPATGEQTPSTK